MRTSLLHPLTHFLLGQAHSLDTEIPHLLCCWKIPHSITLGVFKDFASRATSSSWLAIWTPATNSLSTPVPAPVYSRLVALRIIDNLGKSFASFFLAHVTTSHVLHEPRKRLAEPRPLLTKELRLGNTTGVHTGKDNSSAVMVSSVKLRYCHHVANLRVLVRLGTKEWLSISHFHRLGGTLFKSLQVSKISLWVDKTTTNSVSVSSDGSHNADLRILCLFHIVKKKVHKQKMSKVVDTH
mmetsp:Transcript_12550/g.22771  ORF Transcript_12550/g.22771 Transcript_12550/m.22771 type:complete len:239 (+) Transcript_12550:115-831(+)